MPRYFDRSRYYGGWPPPAEGWSYRAAVVQEYRRAPFRRRAVRQVGGLALSLLSIWGGALLLDWSGTVVVLLTVLVLAVDGLGWWLARRWSRAAPPD